MSNYDQAVEKLLQAIKMHDSVVDFQKVEEKMKDFPELENLVKDMKAYQQEAVLFHKIDKSCAEKKAGEQADQLREELSDIPIVKDYRAKMQDASDLVQYITNSLETKINEELNNGKR
ncbi:hypothetical protein E0E04_02300 [Streptococcus vicugnae]|uniref:Cell fate regulator YmcA, YheA/YmcA/DUF963 family (Controls sporulation, competence, biofilm development) n=1 Tax=Streptococcus vicugnae TaxID=2740579 RepID=A0A4R5G7C7_9STRE|nr:YlbF family regulator [Streptococcus vicugnae]TDE74922.1 hypothetical protein E0E04_02300 [Streptococcus vicugnae]